MSHQLAARLADILGIDYKCKSVVGFDVRARVGQPIGVTVHHALLKLNDVEGKVEHFTLQPIVKPAAAPAPAFDLEVEVAKAQARLRQYIDERAHSHKFAHYIAPMVRAQFRTLIDDLTKAAGR